VLQLDERDAFELSFWCGTCPFLFQRVGEPDTRLSLHALSERLATGLTGLEEDVVATFAQLLPRASYLPLLLVIEPRLVVPGGLGDYFAEEQVRTWGVDAVTGAPESPRTPYYRTFQTALAADAHLYEFVVPMVPPEVNDPRTVAAHRARLAASSSPTAVAVSTLDVCAPATAQEDRDWHWHWCLTHFLLDGHHKLQAAAEDGRPLQLLALLNVDASLADPDRAVAVPRLRARVKQARERGA
jgi:hypothetical protein